MKPLKALIILSISYLISLLGGAYLAHNAASPAAQIGAAMQAYPLFFALLAVALYLATW